MIFSSMRESLCLCFCLFWLYDILYMLYIVDNLVHTCIFFNHSLICTLIRLFICLTYVLYWSPRWHILHIPGIPSANILFLKLQGCFIPSSSQARGFVSILFPRTEWTQNHWFETMVSFHLYSFITWSGSNVP